MPIQSGHFRRKSEWKLNFSMYTQGSHKLFSGEELKAKLKPYIEVVHRVSRLITRCRLLVSSREVQTQWAGRTRPQLPQAPWLFLSARLCVLKGNGQGRKCVYLEQ